MAWLAVDKNKNEWIYEYEPIRFKDSYYPDEGDCVQLPKGSIKKLIGKTLTYRNKPVEI